jgi:Flp pilus assembly protein TadD
MAKAAIAESKRDTEAARQGYEKVLARFPDFTPAKRQLAIIYADKVIDDKKALELATKAREAFPADADVARALGVIMYRTGNFPRAASLLQESARTRTSDAELMYYLGMAQHQAKNPAEAKRSLERAIELGLKDDLAKEAKRVLTPPEKATK